MKPRNDIMSVGQIIYESRKRVKVTQQELAQRVGTNKSYISRVENGSVEPGAGMFLRILSALGMRFEVSQPLSEGFDAMQFAKYYNICN